MLHLVYYMAWEDIGHGRLVSHVQRYQIEDVQEALRKVDKTYEP